MPSYPLSFTTKAPDTERLILTRRQSASESPHNLAIQVVNTASQWMLEWSWPAMRHTDAEIVRAWINSLRGQIGTFRYFPRKAFVSSVTGKTLALPGYAYSNTISLTGWTASQASGLRVGQFFQIGDQLLTVSSAGAVADASGKVTIEFEPPLRKTFTAATAVNFATPSGLFRLSSSDADGFTLTPDRVVNFGTVQAREVVA